MTSFQRVIKYLSIVLAVVLAIAILFGIVAAIKSIFFADDGILDEMRNIEITQDITKIDIDIGAAALKIVEGERFALSTNLKKLNITNSVSRLYIEQSQKNTYIHSTKVGEVILTVPAGAEFDYFELSAGAGKVEIESLTAEKVVLEFGAGEINIGKLIATLSAEIEAGAGAFVIADGAIENLDLDLGVGRTDLTSALGGKCEINCGVGETNISVLSPIESYTVEFNTGIGSVELNDESVKGNITYGNGENEIQINGGVGKINITFQE